MHPFERLLRDSYAAYNARDLDNALKALSPNVEWPDQIEGVYVHGREAVGAYWQRRWDTMDPYFEVGHCDFDADGKLQVTLVQELHGPEEKLISKGFVRHIYEFEDGLVKRMTVIL